MLPAMNVEEPRRHAHRHVDGTVTGVRRPAARRVRTPCLSPIGRDVIASA
jgi:hypothetical protein